MSRSSFSCRVSRRSRTSSARSAAVRPRAAGGGLASRRPSLRSAAATQSRRAGAEGSNARAGSFGSRPARTSSTIWRWNSVGYGGRVLGIGKHLTRKRSRCPPNRGNLSQRRPVLLGGGAEGRLRALSHAHRLGQAGRPLGAVHPCAVSDGARFATGAARRGWVNTCLGNIKTALAGTYHHVSRKHAQRYLSSFVWRFNRCFHLDSMVERLAYAATRTAPHPYRVIIADA